MKPEQGIRFLRQFQELLAEGGFVATYKFALMQALADLSVEHEVAQDGSLKLHVEQLAEKFVEYYWNQARPFHDRVLRQNTKGQAEVLRRIQEYRNLSDGKLGQLQSDRAAWQKLIRHVAAIIVKMPLWKLQTVGNRKNEFLYRKAEYRDRSIRLLPGVPDAFRAFHPMLTSMIRGGWISQIHRIGAHKPVLGAQAELEDFLFGTDRRSLERFTAVIRASPQTRLICPRSCTRSFASRFESGSSSSSTVGSITSARASATRCCWPPESWFGRRSASGSICTARSASFTRRSRSAAATLRTSRPNATFRRTLM